MLVTVVSCNIFRFQAADCESKICPDPLPLNQEGIPDCKLFALWISSLGVFPGFC